MMLSQKQQVFVNEYSLDRNASRAARAAGYSAATSRISGCRLFASDNIQAALKVREYDAEVAMEMTREKVLTALWDAFEDAKERREPAAMIAACKAVAAMCGYNKTERQAVEVSVNVGVDLRRLETMSDAELMQLVQS
jgi:phage terminase small subunit